MSAFTVLKSSLIEIAAAVEAMTFIPGLQEKDRTNDADNLLTRGGGGGTPI